MDIDLLVPRRKPAGPVKIKKNHAMSQGIYACWIFNTRTFPVKDLSGFQAPMINDGSPGATLEMGTNGNIQLVTGDSKHAVVPNFNPSNTGSVIWKMKWVTDDSARQRPFGMSDEFEVFLAGDTTAQLQGQFFRGGTGHPSTILALPTGEYKSLVGTWDEPSTRRELFLDGVFQEGRNDTATDPGAAVLTIGRRTGASNAESFIGELEYLIFKNYAMGEGEAYQWHVDPYQFLEADVDAYPLFITPQTGLTQDLDQFRFYNDDGDEAGATAIAAQNVNITQALGISAIIRQQVNNTGDAPGQKMKIQCKKTTDADSTYADIKVAP